MSMGQNWGISPSRNDDTSSSDDETDDVDPSILFANMKSSDRNSFLGIDAINETRLSDIDSRIRNLKLTSDVIMAIENELGIDEKVSLIFLLYDNEIHLALQDIMLIKEGAQKNIISEWLNQNLYKKELKLLEALTLIKNFKILKQLGFKKEEMKSRFMPAQTVTSVSLNRIKKYLYLLAETIPTSFQSELIANIEKDCKEKKIEFSKRDFIEESFLDLQSIKYITDADLSNLSKHFKELGWDNICQRLADLTRQPSKREMIMKTDKIQNPQDTSSFLIPRTNSAKSDTYEINPDSPGVCLIIDNETFYTEVEEQYVHLVVPCTDKIKNRKGTKYDSERLYNIFKRMGFEVILERNKTHYEMQSIINEVARNFKTEQSSFFLCFLSHGIEGKVIACNSVPIDIEDVKNTITKKNFEGKPKVLIMQSCQGQALQRIGDVYTTDSISPKFQRREVPVTADILEFWSTVPGYASIRSENNGSWFIQSFCDAIENNPGKSLQDICVLTKNKVRQERWETDAKGKIAYVMDCLEKTTLSKFFYFPNFKH